MKTFNAICIAVLLTLVAFVCGASAHTVNYDVQQKSVAAVKVFYTADDPASYAEFEVYAPEGGDLPHQTGRTDRNGFASFIPDRQGAWKVKILGESAHGYHGVTVEVKVDKDLNLESFKKPLAAQYSKFVTGISLIIGLFGLYALLSSRKKQKNEAA
jgi:nickel transport protein